MRGKFGQPVQEILNSHATTVMLPCQESCNSLTCVYELMCAENFFCSLLGVVSRVRLWTLPLQYSTFESTTPGHRH